MIRKLHLWLGLVSGIVVFIVSVTGCILVFEDEIRYATNPYLQNITSAGSLLPPSVLAEKARAAHGQKAAYITWEGIQHPVAVNMQGAKKRSESEVVYLDPHTGRVLGIMDMKKDFFRFILKGHYYLWLPENIGKVIVPAAVLMFLFLLITGTILWWPKKRNQLLAGLTIRWTARWRRVNYDLHNVLGFYSVLFLLIICLTGLVFGYQWFARSVYFISSGGRKMVMTHKGKSGKPMPVENMVDSIWMRQMAQVPLNESNSVVIYFPVKREDVITLYFNPDHTTRYRRDTRYFDQYSGKEVNGKGSGFGNGLYAYATPADKIKRMNFDMHVGAIGGLPGKVIAFLASLFAASLPVTGTLIWLGRKFKSKKG
ncbi:PepSY-associated TM helix domain-containing protein [Chitinophaga sancti]|uniref:PepSY-associated TM helix domain-containing protein n=1 Tax=Chitinophaga sancti TaxID=1004 RepID=UPI002A751301|nr:PepSY-associated TM helix domain-containing protein [Chitinophaga sancti]WPQ66201.1 PepSY-associated TM helix domain-containing protein [Chitinophaga sancti]